MRDRSHKTLPFPGILRKKLGVFGRRRLAERCFSPLLAGVALAVLLFLAGILLDRFWEIAPVLRCAFPLLSGLAVLGGIGLAILRVFRRPRDPEVLAGAIDNRLEDSLDTLRSAVNFIRRQQEGESPGHKVLVAQTAREAERMAEELEPAYVTSFSKTWRGVGLVAILCGLSFLTAQHPGMPMKLLVKRFFDPYGNYPRPSWTQIHLVGDVPSSLEAGNDLELTARVSGGRSDPEVCTLVMLPAGADQAPQRLDMQPLPDGTFQGRVRNVSESFSFFIEARDGRTARRKIEVLEPPRIVSMEATYRPPRYARREKRTESVKYREFRGLAGTSVSVEFKTDSPVRDASVTVEFTKGGEGKGKPGWARGKAAIQIFLNQERKRKEKMEGPKTITRKVPVEWDTESLTGRFRFSLNEPGLLRVNLVGKNGVSNRFNPSYRLTVIPDNPPAVSITNLPEQVDIRPDDVLRVNYRARDDIGISDLQYRVRRQRGQSEAEFIPLDKFGGKEAEGEAAIPVNELAPQDKYTLAGGHQDVTIDFTLEAIDTKGQSTSSRRVRVRVLRETYDRSLAELITHLGDLSGACQRGKRSFNSAVNSLIIFRDSLGEGSEWDETRKKKLKKIVSQIRPLEYRGHGARMRSVAYKFSTYPYRAQRAGDYLFSRAEYLNKDYSPLAELGKDADPNRKLGTAIELLKMQKRFLSDLQSAVNGTIEMLRTDRLNYLMKLLRRDLSRFNPDAGEEYVELFRGRQSARATSIAKAVKQLNLPDDSEIEDAIGKLETAAEKFDIEAISEASSKLQEAFREKSVFAGNRPKAFHNLRANWSDGVLIKQAKGEAEAGMRNDPLVPIKKVWGKEIQLAGDARLTDENRMAARALGLLQIETGEAQPQKLIESLDDDRPADAYLVLDHLNQAFQEGRALLEGVGSGRVNASSLAAERCWRRFRDVLLVLMDEVENGGVAVSENELEKEFERLLGFRPLVSRWDVAGVLDGPTERARLVELVFRLDKARQLAFCLPELTGTDSETMLKEACGYLAEMFQNLRADAFQRMEFLKKKVQEEGEADVVLRDGEHKWPDYSKYGVEREKDILRYTGLYRKVLDLAEVQRILEGEFNPEWAGRYDAVTRYIWWLGNDVALSFGRYEGPSVVRRHARGAGAFLNKMETYPDNLEKAAVALEKLAGKDNAVDAVETLVKTARIELEMEEAAKRSRQYCDLLEKPADLKKAREDFARAYGEPIAGAYLAAQIAIPLRRLSRGLMDPNTSEEDWWKTLRANAREAKTLLQILEDRSRAAEDVLLELKLFTDAETERPDEDVCRESARVINGFLETLEPKIELPPVRVKLSKQMRRESRLNAREYHSRERTFRLWRLEISRQARYCERETVELLLRRALRHKIQGALKGLQAQFAHYRVAMRKSQGVERESGGQLDVKIAGVKFERLAMPKYLYEELLRANAKPYPKQFKEQGLDYIRGLLNDAKR